MPSSKRSTRPTPTESTDGLGTPPKKRKRRIDSFVPQRSPPLLNMPAIDEMIKQRILRDTHWIFRKFPIKEPELRIEVDWHNFSKAVKRQIEKFIAFGYAHTQNGPAHDVAGYILDVHRELKFMQRERDYLGQEAIDTFYPRVSPPASHRGVYSNGGSSMHYLKVVDTVKLPMKPLVHMVNTKAVKLKLADPHKYSLITQTHDKWFKVFNDHVLIASRNEHELKRFEASITLEELWGAQEAMGEYRAHIKMPWDL